MHSIGVDQDGPLDGLRWEHFVVDPLGATLGAEVRGVDLGTPLPGPVLNELREALLAFKVLFFRDLPLTTGQHLAVAAAFGEPFIHPLIAPDPAHPLVERHRRDTATAGTENAWHSDISWHSTPAALTLLRAVCVPPSGGDTLFADMAAVHDDLPEDLRGHLVAKIDRPEYQCRFQWQDHSVALWDNRSILHYACSDYWPATRIMERTMVVGDRPA